MRIAGRRSQFLTREEIEKLPRWARVAFAARCARRVEPFYLRVPMLGKKYGPAVTRAIDVAFGFSSGRLCASPSGSENVGSAQRIIEDAGRAADLASWIAYDGSDPAARMRGQDAYGSASRAASSAEAAAYAAAQVTYADQALFWAWNATECCISYRTPAPGPLEVAYARAERQDYTALLQAAHRQAWTHHSHVPETFFGPLWPNGLPEGWPTGISQSLLQARPAPYDFLIDPDDASAEEIALLLKKISDLYCFLGGSGLHLELAEGQTSKVNAASQPRDPCDQDDQPGVYRVWAIPIAFEVGICKRIEQKLWAQFPVWFFSTLKLGCGLLVQQVRQDKPGQETSKGARTLERAIEMKGVNEVVDSRAIIPRRRGVTRLHREN